MQPHDARLRLTRPTYVRPKSRNSLPGLAGLRTLGAVLGTRLLAILDALGVERPAHDVIAHTGQVFDPAAANQHHRVLLQVVAFAADVGNDLESVGKPHFGDLAQG